MILQIQIAGTSNLNRKRPSSIQSVEDTKAGYERKAICKK